MSSTALNFQRFCAPRTLVRGKIRLYFAHQCLYATRRCFGSKRPFPTLESKVMRAVRVHTPGDPSKLVMDHDVPKPSPGEGELLIENRYSGLNFHDTYTRSGLYKMNLPFVVGCEGGGYVVAVGKGIPEVRIGERVAYFSDGSYAEYTSVPAHRACVVPPETGMTLRSAVGLMVQGFTAHYLARSMYKIRPGNTCLIHAGAGGTGGLLVQLAKQLGATVIATASSKKADLARQHGADHVVVYRDPGFTLGVVPGWAAEVRQLTNGEGCDVVYDSVGKDTAIDSLSCLKKRGTCVLFGNASGPPPLIDPLLLSSLGSLTVCRPKLHDFMLDEAETEWRAKEIFHGVYPLKLTLQEVLPLEEAQKAHAMIEAGLTQGKILFKIQQ